MDHHHGPITAILAAMTRLGEADAKKIAVEASVAYSTTVKKLRGLAADGRALRRDDGNGPALWRTTATETAPANHGSDLVNAEAVPDLDPAPTTVMPAAGADVALAPDSAPTRPSGDSATSPVDPSTADETHTPAVDQEADPGLGEPVQADQPGDASDDTATPESGVEHPASQAVAPSAETAPTNPATGSGPEPDSSELRSIEAGAASPTGSATADVPAARRGKGKLRDEVLAVLQDNPDTAYKVSQLSKLLGGASQGAITNALHKLVTDGTVTQTVERPATYQAN